MTLKKHLFIVPFLVHALIGLSQTDTLNRTDSKGNHIGWWKIHGDQETYFEYYHNGWFLQQIRYRNKDNTLECKIIVDLKKKIIFDKNYNDRELLEVVNINKISDTSKPFRWDSSEAVGGTPFSETVYDTSVRDRGTNVKFQKSFSSSKITLKEYKSKGCSYWTIIYYYKNGKFEHTEIYLCDEKPKNQVKVITLYTPIEGYDVDDPEE